MTQAELLKKATKIVATIGPATETETMIEQLIHNGMNVARFNTKHGTVEWHHERILRVRAVSERLGVPIGILLDLQGPEIRLNVPGGETFAVTKGERIHFTSQDLNVDPRSPHIPQTVIDVVQVDDSMLIADGLGEFVVREKHEGLLIAEAMGNFNVGHRKTLNTPGHVIDQPSLVEADLAQLNAVSDDLIDFVGLSFVRGKRDLEALRAELVQRNIHADIIAKIENRAAIDNLDEIIASADGIMVARGDLGVELPMYELPHWQKHIILQSRLHGKPVITATQMLKSMVDQPRPTRAEVSDVATAIYDGTDAIMLSEETTIGQFPVEAVATQAEIAEYNEQYAQVPALELQLNTPSESVTQAAFTLANQSDKPIACIVCLTELGTTAKLLSRLRPKVPLHVLTSNKHTYRKLTLLYHVAPHLIELPESDRLESSEKLLNQLVTLSIALPGDTILLVHGTFWKKPGLTNTMALLQVPTPEGE